ncbi:unnamed protein product [Echinostoma caproni]|uniref:G_PROTEIN_RECEP_F1_2 domain-containing protein n=1 Tax=Echinostoma caproni TaxID=27848 RepID=A0A183AHL8_9TREM|nr:unnamed protein product [Echinostoma caproni]
MSDPFMQATKTNTCYAYIFLRELFDRCEPRSTHEALAEVAAGFAAVMTSQEIRVDDKRIEWVFHTCLLLCIAAIVSVLQVAPAFVIYGLWQHHGVFACAPDPIIPYEYHLYFNVHKTMFIDGMFQCTCSVLLSVIIYRQFKRVQRIVNQLRSVHLSRDVVSVTLLATILRLDETSQNMRILFSLLFPTICSRLARLCLPDPSAMAKDANYTTSREARLRRLTKLSLWHLITYLDILISGFGYWCWYINVPKLISTIKTGYEYFMRWIRRKRRKRRGRRVARSYFRQSCISMGIRIDDLHRNKTIINQLNALQQHLGVFYADELQEAERLLNSLDYAFD